MFRLGSQSMSIMEWLSQCATSLSKERFGSLLVMLWFVWKERNKRVWNNKFLSQYQIFFQATTYLHTLRSVQPKSNGNRRLLRTWVPPPIGWLKVNIDGAFCASSSSGGVGVIVRDSDGRIVAGMCKRLSHVMGPDMVEAMAGRVACVLATSYNLSPIVFESDCMKVINASKNEEVDNSSFGLIMEDVKALLGGLLSSFFVHVIREANMVAHKAAKFALQDGFDISWSGHLPDVCQDFLAPVCNL